MIKKSQIQKWNDYFKSLSKKGKRVAIAKDVLKQLEKDKYIARKGVYTSYLTDLSTSQEEFGQLNVRENFDKINKCEVCALGSMVLSCTKFVNKLSFNDINSETARMWNLLRKYFSDKDLVLMEYSFEGFKEPKNNSRDALNGVANKFNVFLSSEEYKKCKTFFDKYESIDERLKGIMKNIIKNEGKFKP